MTEKVDRQPRIMRNETVISYVIITILVAILSAFIGRETVSAQLTGLQSQVSELKTGRLLNEQGIKALSADNLVKMQMLTDIQKDVSEIKTMFAAHTGLPVGKK